MPANKSLFFLLVTLLWTVSTPAQVIVSEATDTSADIAKTDGKIAFDLLGQIWLVNSNGGAATRLENVALPAKRPRWSPTADAVMYETSSASENQIWLRPYPFGESVRLSIDGSSDQHAAWHPDGERVVFTSERNESGLDLWEIDLDTRLQWRISDLIGDEFDPAWSADGRNLAYIAHNVNGWQLMLREHGEKDRVLATSPLALRVPAWRPDGTLITYLAEAEAGYELNMAILSEPVLLRTYSNRESDLFVSPVSWVDRQMMIYTANGQIMRRNFADRSGTPLHFRATLRSPQPAPTVNAPPPELPLVSPPSSKLVIRTARLYDGTSNRYRHNVDIVIDGPLITAVEARNEWPGYTILNLGGATVLPGFIDVYSGLPEGNTASVGASLLSYGVTTLVTNADTGILDTAAWHTEPTPGPRLLRMGAVPIQMTDGVEDPLLALLPASSIPAPELSASVVNTQVLGIPVMAENWGNSRDVKIDLLLGAASLPASPLDHQFQDMRMASDNGQVTLASALADAGTPGVSSLLQSRQATIGDQSAFPMRRFVETPNLADLRNTIVVGSKPNGLPAGLALHAELRALAAAGLDSDRILQAAGKNAAAALRLDRQIGTVQPGKFADLVIISGDPLNTVADTINIIAVVRNGRFFSLVGLLDRLPTVE